jgi:colanic acid biosynthesis glycosyl transferase WcaI
LQATAEQLVRCGHEVEVVTARPNYPLGKFFDGRGLSPYVREERNGIPVHRVIVYPAVGGGLGRMLNYLSFAIMSIAGLLRAKRPDYLFVESPPLLMCIPAFLAKRIFGIPYIFNISDLWPDAIAEAGLIPNRLLLRTLLGMESFSYRHAAYVSVVTDSIRESLISQKHVPADKILFLPNGANLARDRPREADPRFKASLNLGGKKIILWAGTIGYAHGLEFVLQAAKLLEQRPEIHFLFLGDGSARSDLETLAAAMDLTNVSFKDPVPNDELAPYYGIADCGLASLRILEANRGARPSKIFPVWASGRAVIFIGEGECARVVEASRAGIVVPPENPALLAREIFRLLEQPGLTAQLGENGRRFVEENYDWSNIIANWLRNLHQAPRGAFTPSSISATR